MATKQQVSPAVRRARALALALDELAALGAAVAARYGEVGVFTDDTPGTAADEADARALMDLAAELRALRAGPGLAG